MFGNGTGRSFQLQNEVGGVKDHSSLWPPSHLIMFVFSESTPCTRMNGFFSIKKDGASTFLHGYLEEEGDTTLYKQTKQVKCHSLRQHYFAIWGEIIFCKILKDMLCFAEQMESSANN